MQNKRCKIVLIALVVLLSKSAFAGLPTETELNKYCIQARMVVDGDIHNFAVKAISDFTNDGFTVSWGRHGENKTYYLREQFLNYDEMKEKYLRLKKEFNL